MEYKLCAQAFRGYDESYEFNPSTDGGIWSYFDSKRDALAQLLIRKLNDLQTIKVSGSLQVKYTKPTYTGVDQDTKPYFHTKPFTLLHASQVQETMDFIFEELGERMYNYEGEGSGWVFDKVISFQVNIHKHVPLRASSYMEIPAEVQNTKSVVNIQNKDHKCFMWSILAYLHPAQKNPQRVSKYEPFKNELKFDGIEFPVKLQDITKFETQNQISVNVFGYDPEHWIYPLRITKAEHQKHVDLLYIVDKENSHYCLIKSFNGLMHRHSKNRKKKFFCKHCLHGFCREELLQEHMPDCVEINGAQKTYLPDPESSNLQFTNHHKGLKVPFVIYADFESITQPIEQAERDPSQSYTDGYQVHIPCSFAYKVVCIDERYTETVTYRSDNLIGTGVIGVFIRELQKEKWRIWKILKESKPLNMTEENERDFQAATICHICGEHLEEDKVKDHCHVTGKYRGAAHNQCNLKYRIPRFIPVVFHNLKGYDSHLIMQHLGELDAEVTCIPNNMEKYISFTVADRYEAKHSKRKTSEGEKEEEEEPEGEEDEPEEEEEDEPEEEEEEPEEEEDEPEEEPKGQKKGNKKKVSKVLNFRFIDSLAFMNSSLENLVQNLKASGLENFKNLRRRFGNDQTTLDLITRKGVYPYDYINSLDRFKERQLPAKEEFYNKLNDEHISDEDYSHAVKVWDHFHMRNLGKYHDLYLETDVLLLADVFEHFRDTCLSSYSLDPCHYFTAPGLSWDACLKKSGVKLELLTDMNMHLMIEKGIRGGISTITHRHGVANNKYMKEYDSSKESSYIIYLDANNLYGWSMSQHLPTKNFQWVPQDEIAALDLLKINDNGDEGYILEVDLQYPPPELHDLHNDYPLAAERLLVDDTMLSEYSQDLSRKFNMGNSTTAKLIPNLRNKINYVVHYRNLKQYLKLGMKLIRIHRAIKFEQQPWLKPYIDFNTERRKEARNPFEKDFYKLMNNSVFGKTIENIRKRVDVRLVNDEKRRNKLVSQPHFRRMLVFDTEHKERLIWMPPPKPMVGIQMKKKSILLNKPIYCGLTILDNSKVLMYNFHYNYIKQRYGSDATLLFTDTDSLCYHIKTQDIYQDMFQRKELFDFSDYPKESKFHDPTNKKVIGKMKDETASVPIVEFVGLRSKMYSVKAEAFESKRAKGVKKSVVRHQIRHADYLKTLEERTRSMVLMKGIRSKQHQVRSYEINKIGLSCYDDKRYILPDGKTTLAYGHHAINQPPTAFKRRCVESDSEAKRTCL